MIHCSHLNINTLEGRKLIEDLSFSVEAGEHVGLIAQEGVGKSTLLKLLAGEKPDYVQITGTHSVQGKAGYLPPLLEEKWKESTPCEFLLCQEPSEWIEPEAWNQLAKANRIASRIGLPADLLSSDQAMGTLSGGELLRMLWLKMEMDDPDFYLLDEPGRDLDLDGIRLMETLISQSAKPVLFVSHDADLLSSCAQAILHLELRNHRSKPVWTWYGGGYEEYLEDRAARRARLEQTAAGQKREYAAQKQRLNDLHNQVAAKLQTVSRQMPNVAKNLKDKMRAVKSQQKNLEREERIELDSLEEEISFAFEPSGLPKNKVIVHAEHEQLAIEEQILLQDFSLSLSGKDKAALTGSNGTGKSTLLAWIYNNLQQREDLVVGYMPQDYLDAVDAAACALDFVSDAASQEKVRTMLGCLHFSPAEQLQPISECSSGQKAMLYLAKLALQGCNVLLLDEPSRNLSVLSQQVLIEALQKYDGCVIAVSHDRHFIRECFDRVFELKDGTIAEKQIQR